MLLHHQYNIQSYWQLKSQSLQYFFEITVYLATAPNYVMSTLPLREEEERKGVSGRNKDTAGVQRAALT